MKTIPLTQGQVALVDDADYESVSQHKWYARKESHGFYAVRTVQKPDGRRALQYLHQFLIPGVRSDHRDGNKLDNRRSNLRPATAQQNNRGFRQKRLNTSSRFRGVCWHRGGRKWMARIKVDGKQPYLGLFTKEKDAAKAYDIAARKYFGEFASPNFP